MSKSNVTLHLHQVHPRHLVLEKGVRFNVQTVSSLGRPLKLQTAAQTAEWVANCARMASSIAFDEEDTKGQALSSVSGRRIDKFVKIEQHSVPDNVLVEAHSRSLMEICLAAFANHYPLTLSPDHIWIVIAYGAAKHINKNAEALRERFVSFEGKKALIIEKDDAVMGHVPVREWESDVFEEFSKQIRTHIGDSTHQLFAAPFSTTSSAEMTAAAITLMAATKDYFTFEMTTGCGIPSIELEGTLDDWMELRKRAAKLGELLLPDFAEKWLTNLLPVLDEFVSAYKGAVNHAFWQRMVKKYSSGMSGATPVLSGWINNLYPYLANGRINRHMKSWVSTSQHCGPNPKEFPQIVSTVAVKWRYFGSEFPLRFHAGYLGMSQDQSTLALRPYIGWVVSHDKQNKSELEAVNGRE